MPDLTFEKALPDILARAEDLPSMPAVAVEVLRLTQDEDSTLDDLAETLSRDPVLAAKLLKLSNSSLFSQGSAITTLQRATMVLGMKTVKLMSLSFSLAGSLPSKGSQGSFDFSRYWHHSLVNAVAARALAKRVGGDGDEAFLCGLLGHIGRLVLARSVTELYEPVVVEGEGWPGFGLESRRLGFHHADIAATLLRDWDLPPAIYLPVGFRNRPEDLPTEADANTRSMTELLHTVLLIEEVLCGDGNPGRHLEELQKLAETRHGMPPDDLDAFLLGLEFGIAETAEMMNVSLPGDISHQEILNQARLQMVSVGTGLAVESRQNQERAEVFKTEANTDRLTGLSNRRHFNDYYENQVELRRTSQVSRALGLILLDLDRFKSFNDTYGHDAGDEVLRMVGSVLSQHTRKSDLAARYGGEEFVVVLPNTNPFGLKTTAERLRKAIEEIVLKHDGHVLRVTASFGGACLATLETEKDGRDLLKLADHFLYKAKENGRNRCEIFPRVRLPRR